MRFRVLLLAAGAALTLTPLRAPAQLPLSGVDLSAWVTVVSAASRNKTDDVINLLVSGKPADDFDDDGKSGLTYAASFGNAEMARALIKYHANVDHRDKLGDTPLHWAAERGSVDVMQLLIDGKATVDVQNRQGITPLMLAASKGQVQAVRLLLKHAADPRKQDYTGRDATSWAEGKANVLQALRSASAG